MATEPNPAPSNGIIPPSNNEDYLEEHGITQKLPVREVRAAVSMVGGTSLAIYENGVAQELFRMVHGQGIYGVLKWLTHSHAYIDILSGTSAGGMNTIFLSTALTVGTDFLPTKTRWIKVGGIDDLLHNPRNTKEINSLFKGNSYYYNEIYGAFDQLSDPEQPMKWNLYQENPGIPSGWRLYGDCREYQDLDLFVTGTYLRGRPETYFDARTKPLFNLNHAGVFHLKHRARRDESHFHPRMKDPSSSIKTMDHPEDAWPGCDPITNPEGRMRGVHERLARVARSTSSLPAIFEPSKVCRQLMNGIISLPTKTEVNYMGDGGYLNNRPLNLVLRAIMERPAEREVVRKIFFVEPSPQDLPAPLTTDPVEPSALQHLAFAATIPMGQSISSTLQQIYEHNRKVRRIDEALRTAQLQVLALVREPVQGSLPTSVSALVSANPTARAQHDLWIKIRLQELRDQMIDCWEFGLGLQDYGGVLEDDDPITRHDNLQKLALPLRVIRSKLVGLIERNCIDLNPELRQTQVATASPTASPTAAVTPYTVSSIDATWLKRKIHRAINDIYEALYPKSTTDPIPAPPTGTGLAAEEQRRIYQLIQPRLRELNHLIDLAEIVEENMGLVQVTVAKSLEYQQAEDATHSERNMAGADPLDTAIDALWKTLVGCLRELLAPVDGLLSQELHAATNEDAPLIAETDSLVNETEQQRREREQANVALLSGIAGSGDGVFTRSTRICATLIDKTGSEAANIREKWRQDAQNPSPEEMVLDQIDQYVNRIVREAAIILLPSREALAKENEFSLAWAMNPQTTARDSGTAPSSRIAPAEAIGINIELLDIYLYPIERAAELQARNSIGIVQISPRDVQIGLSKKTPADKISGDILGNLGGFLKSSWRANDILWGRLDGSGAIADTLWDQAHICRILGHDPEAAERMIVALEQYIAQGLTPNSDATANGTPPKPDEIGTYLETWYEQDRNKIRDWLRGGHLKEPAVSLDNAPTPFRLILEWLLRRHQMEILMTEVPSVVTQALIEHAQWQARSEANAEAPVIRETQNSAHPTATTPRSAPTSNASSQTPQPPIGAKAKPSSKAAPNIEPSLHEKADELAPRLGPRPNAMTRDAFQADAQRLSENLFSNGANVEGNSATKGLSPQKIESYFRYRYAVGAENVADDVPPLVSLRRVLTFILLILQLLSNNLSANKGLTGTVARAILTPLTLLFGIVHSFVITLTQGDRVAAAMHAVGLTLISLVIALKLFTTLELPPAFYVLALAVVLSEIILLRLNSRWWPIIKRIGLFTTIIILSSFIISETLVLGGIKPSHILLNLNAFANGMPYITLSCLLTATVALMMILNSLNPKGPGNQGGIVAFELAGTARRSDELMRDWGESGRAIARKNLLYDAFFAPIYSTTLALVCVMTAMGLQNTLQPRLNDFFFNLGICLAWSAWGAGILDWLENLFLYQQLAIFSKTERAKAQNVQTESSETRDSATNSSQPAPGRADALAKTAQSCAVLKFALILAGLVYLLVASAALANAEKPDPEVECQCCTVNSNNSNRTH